MFSLSPTWVAPFFYLSFWLTSLPVGATAFSWFEVCPKRPWMCHANCALAFVTLNELTPMCEVIYWLWMVTCLTWAPTHMALLRLCFSDGHGNLLKWTQLWLGSKASIFCTKNRDQSEFVEAHIGLGLLPGWCLSSFGLWVIVDFRQQLIKTSAAAQKRDNLHHCDCDSVCLASCAGSTKGQLNHRDNL